MSFLSFFSFFWIDSGKRKNISFDGPAPTPDVACFDIKNRDDIADLWSAAASAMETARATTTSSSSSSSTTTSSSSSSSSSSSTGTNHEQETWTIWFRKKGVQVKQIGQPIRFDHPSAIRLAKALIIAENLVDTDLSFGKKLANNCNAQAMGQLKQQEEENESKRIGSFKGGGEDSDFRRKLRRQSVAIKRKNSGAKQRRKSYAANIGLDQLEVVTDAEVSAAVAAAAASGGRAPGVVSVVKKNHSRMRSFSEKSEEQEEDE